jgi:hypothetical protein
MWAKGLIAFLAVGVAFVALLATSAGARPSVWRPRPSPRFSISAESLDGATLRTFQHRGTQFVLGAPGEAYRLRIRNPTAQRVEVVASVDGRDVVSGEVADFTSQRGYLVEPFGSLVIEGFRQSLHEVATFRFSAPEASYSARRGTPENVGVIGAAFFPERRQRPLPLAERGSNKRAEPASPGARRPRSAAPSEAKGRAHRGQDLARDESVNRLGTEYGESRTSSVMQVAFERQDRTRPAQIVALRYDDASGLEARGIAVFPEFRRQPLAEPVAFPMQRFAAPPP